MPNADLDCVDAKDGICKGYLLRYVPRYIIHRNDCTYISLSTPSSRPDQRSGKHAEGGLYQGSEIVATRITDRSIDCYAPYTVVNIDIGRSIKCFGVCRPIPGSMRCLGVTLAMVKTET